MADELDIVVKDGGSADVVRKDIDSIGTAAVGAQSKMGSLGSAVGDLAGRGMNSVQNAFGTATGKLTDYTNRVGQSIAAHGGLGNAVMNTTSQFGGWIQRQISADTSLVSLVGNMETGNLRMRSLATTAQSLQSTMIALAGSFVAKEFFDFVENTQQIEARLGLLESRGIDAKKAYDGLLTSAQRTGTSIKSAAEIFEALNDVLNANQGKVVSFGNGLHVATLGVDDLQGTTRLALQAIAFYPTTFQNSQAAATAFANSMRAGALTTGDWNTIMRTSPTLANLLARALNTTTDQMAAFAASGQATTQKIVEGIDQQRSALQGMTVPLPTLSVAWGTLAERIQSYIGTAQSANGVTNFTVNLLKLMAENLPQTITLVSTLAIAFGSLLALRVAFWIGELLVQLAILSGQLVVLIAQGIAWTLSMAPQILAVAALAAGLTVLYLAMTGQLSLIPDAIAKGQAWVASLGEQWEAIKKMTSATNQGADSQKNLQEWMRSYQGAGQNLTNSTNSVTDATKSATSAVNDYGSALGNTTGAASSAIGANDALAQSFGGVKSAAEQAYEATAAAQTRYANNFRQGDSGTNVTPWSASAANSNFNYGASFQNISGVGTPGYKGGGTVTGSIGAVPDTSSYSAANPAPIAPAGFLTNDPIASSLADPLRYFWTPGQYNGPHFFANGADMMVSGKSGTDTNLVQFMATAGERVLVQTPEQQRKHTSGGQTVNVTYNVADYNSFKRNQKQLTQDFIRKLAV